jgi:RimJ/RimL family protein N-acetyltransferase
VRPAHGPLALEPSTLPKSRTSHERKEYLPTEPQPRWYGPEMSDTASWPVAMPIATARLQLEPLRVEHAAEAFAVFDDARLHTWTGGSPYSPDRLRERYGRQAAGRSPDGTRGWLNWMLRRTGDGRLVGTVQATAHRPAPDRLEAELAWVIGHPYQGNGYGREAALAMADWLRAHGVTALAAHIHPENAASIGIARALGLTATNTVVDGEIRWTETGNR